MIDITGIAHIVLAVSEWDRCRPFYEDLFGFMGLQRVFSGDKGMYFVGRHLAVGVGECDEAYRSTRFVQGAVGLHHVCFSAKSRADVDAAHAHLVERGATIVRAPSDGPWAPGYYSTLFEDPAGLRIEINHVPGKGVFDEGFAFEAAGDYR